MKLQQVVFTTAAIAASVIAVLSTKPALACNSGISRLDPTCPGRILNPGGGGGNSGSSVGADMTPPQVRTARDLISRGYWCIDIREYSLYTCHTPSGMDSSSFRASQVGYWGAYLGSRRQWSWGCLNNNGQLWGTADGQLLCQPGMR